MGFSCKTLGHYQVVHYRVVMKKNNAILIITICSELQNCVLIYSGLSALSSIQALNAVATMQHTMEALGNWMTHVGGSFNLTMSRIICVTFSTGFLSSSALHFRMWSGSGGAIQGAPQST